MEATAMISNNTSAAITLRRVQINRRNFIVRIILDPLPGARNKTSGVVKGNSASTRQPLVPVGRHKFVITQVRVRTAHAINFLALTGAESFIGVETPQSFEQTLAA
jgi:hypothetical protein